MVNVGGDAQDVLLKQGVQLATVGLATTNVELIIEACGIGPQGPPGVSGNVIHSGDGPPDADVGSPGDYYIDVTGHDLYGPKGYGGGPLPMSHVENYEFPVVPGAVVALTDSSDATAVRISSAEVSEWFVYFNAPLTETSVFQIQLRFNVISHGAKPFVFRCTLHDYGWSDADVDFRATLANGFNDYTLTVDQAWLNTHPFNPGNPDQNSAWTTDSVYGVPENYANLVALLGSTPVLGIRGYDGLPYEVDLVSAAILAGGSAWGVPVPLDQGPPGPPGPPGADGLDGDDGSDGSVVLYEQPNDPGAVDEGSMWIDTDSTVVPYVDEDEGGSGGDYENVRDHGAVGDGVTDDGDAIQAAIDAGAANGRAVYFPTGTYLISQQLNLHTGTVLEGAGRTSIIKLVGGYTENIDMIATANGDGTHDVTIRRLVVDGNKENISTEATWTIDTAPWTTCLHLLDVTNLVLEDLLIKNSTIEGVYLYHVHYGSVSRVEASENGFWRKDASGIHLDTCDHVVVDNSVTNHNGFHGIILSAATDNVIANHYAADNGFDGTRLQWSADRNRYEKFIAERNSRGIYVMHDSTLNHFTHCTLRDSLWNGFFSNNCRGNDLTFTHIEGSGEYAVGSVEAGDNQRGYGNTYRNNALGDYSLAAGSTFSTIAGAGEAI